MDEFPYYTQGNMGPRTRGQRVSKRSIQISLPRLVEDAPNEEHIGLDPGLTLGFEADEFPYYTQGNMGPTTRGKRVSKTNIQMPLPSLLEDAQNEEHIGLDSGLTMGFEAGGGSNGTSDLLSKSVQQPNSVQTPFACDKMTSEAVTGTRARIHKRLGQPRVRSDLGETRGPPVQEPTQRVDPHPTSDEFPYYTQVNIGSRTMRQRISKRNIQMSLTSALEDASNDQHSRVNSGLTLGFEAGNGSNGTSNLFSETLQHPSSVQMATAGDKMTSVKVTGARARYSKRLAQQRGSSP